MKPRKKQAKTWTLCAVAHGKKLNMQYIFSLTLDILHKQIDI